MSELNAIDEYLEHHYYQEIFDYYGRPDIQASILEEKRQQYFAELAQQRATHLDGVVRLCVEVETAYEMSPERELVASK